MLKCSSVLGCQVSFLGCFCWVIVSPFCWLHRSSAKRRRSFCFTLKRVLPIGTKDMGSDVFVELRSAPRKSGWVQDCKDPRWSAKLFIWPQNKTFIYLYIVDTHIEIKSWGLWIYSFLLRWRFSPSKSMEAKTHTKLNPLPESNLPDTHRLSCLSLGPQQCECQLNNPAPNLWKIYST